MISKSRYTKAGGANRISTQKYRRSPSKIHRYLCNYLVKVLKVTYPALFPLIVLFCLVGAYSLNSSILDVLTMTAFGLIGYLMKKLDYEPAPMIMAYVLGPILELNLRRSLVMSGGEFNIFVYRPISLGILILAGTLISISLLANLRKIKPPAEAII